jgi:hypothetical protein
MLTEEFENDAYHKLVLVAFDDKLNTFAVFPLFVRVRVKFAVEYLTAFLNVEDDVIVITLTFNVLAVDCPLLLAESVQLTYQLKEPFNSVEFAVIVVAVLLITDALDP